MIKSIKILKGGIKLLKKENIEKARDCEVYPEEKGTKECCENCKNKKVCRAINPYSSLLTQTRTG